MNFDWKTIGWAMGVWTTNPKIGVDYHSILT